MPQDASARTEASATAPLETLAESRNDATPAPILTLSHI